MHSDLPPTGLWFMFSPRCRFHHNRIDWPEFKAWRGSDQRIMAKTIDLHRAGGRVTFYQYPQIEYFNSLAANPPTRFCVEVVDPAYTGPRYLPSWFGFDFVSRVSNLSHASIFYVG